MNIGTIGTRQYTDIFKNGPALKGTSAQASSAAEKDTAAAENSLRAYAAKSEIEYYNALCDLYPDITFRLDDMASAMSFNSNDGCPYLGYNNSMNQIGSNFGEINQYSISIDISVIRNMQRDPAYEASVLDTIQDTQARYSNYQSRAKEQGMFYFCVNIEDNGGNIQRSTTYSHTAFSTEDEVKAMWNKNTQASHAIEKLEEVQNELLENYMKLLSEHNKELQEKLKEIIAEEPIENEESSEKEIYPSEEIDMDQRIAQILYDPS